MTDHAQNKALVAAMLAEVAEAAPDAIAPVLARYCSPDVLWRIFHPFNDLTGIDAAAEHFFAPLKTAFPDYEQRANLFLGGEYEGRDWVSTLGHVMGNFEAPWLGIPPTGGLVFLRFGMQAVVRDGKIAKVHILLDIVDLMRQAGFYPFRRMPGTAEQWPAPPCSAGGPIGTHDGALGAETMKIVLDMQNGLGKPDELHDMAKIGQRHHHNWHKDMNWYGPAGVGSSRNKRGFLDYHGALFIIAFNDRSGFERAHTGEEDRPGHFIRIGDGRFAVTNGWPSLKGTRTGAGWLGMPPTGKHVIMRVADWYRVDDRGLIIDNWVMMDIPHILMQEGYDILDDLRYFVDPMLPRWPR